MGIVFMVTNRRPTRVPDRAGPSGLTQRTMAIAELHLRVWRPDAEQAFE